MILFSLCEIMMEVIFCFFSFWINFSKFVFFFLFNVVVGLFKINRWMDFDNVLVILISCCCFMLIWDIRRFGLIDKLILFSNLYVFFFVSF